ncbi:hypothetical protein [Micromonospora sp. LOL_021]|uniref:hypothetical protein n=1 Tax=Micromonospora sp. LOL_021 TaxID=3345417 RepID=UPI003A8BEA19
MPKASFGCGTWPDEQLGYVLFRNAVDEQRDPSLVEGVNDSTVLAERQVERGGEDDGGGVADRPAHSYHVVDVFADHLRLNHRITGVEDDNLDIVLHDTEQFTEGGSADSVFTCPIDGRVPAFRSEFAALREGSVSGQHNLAGLTAVDAEMDDVRHVLIEVLQQIVGAGDQAGHQFERVPLRGRPQGGDDLPHLHVEGEPVAGQRIG